MNAATATTVVVVGPNGQPIAGSNPVPQASAPAANAAAPVPSGCGAALVACRVDQ